MGQKQYSKTAIYEKILGNVRRCNAGSGSNVSTVVLESATVVVAIEAVAGWSVYFNLCRPPPLRSIGMLEPTDHRPPAHKLHTTTDHALLIHPFPHCHLNVPHRLAGHTLDVPTFRCNVRM